MNLDLIKSQVESPFTNPMGEIDVKGLCDALQIERAKLPDMIGVSRQTVAHYFVHDVRFIKLRVHEVQDFFANLSRLYVLIRTVMGKGTTDHQIVEWFHSPNKALKMKTPRDLVYENKIGVLIKKLMDVITAAQGG